MRIDCLARKVDGVRAAAGDRFDDLELNTMITGPVMVTGDREEGAAGILHFLGNSGYPIHVPDDFTEKDILQSPYLVIGTHAEIADQLVAQREEYGISYITVISPSMHDFAPVVEMLAGT